MERVALFPGTFDPFTRGHESIVNRALPLFDRIIIGVGYNSSKDSGLFPVDKRVEVISKLFKDNSSVSVEKYDCLTVEMCRKNKAGFIIRGIRNIVDFEYEKSLAQTNKVLEPGVETVFFFADQDLAAINSSILRDILRHDGDISKFLP